MIQPGCEISDRGTLRFAGAEVNMLADEYATPVYLMDEERLRSNMRLHRNAVRHAFGPDALPFYASKALCFTALDRMLAGEGFGLDVVSGGELFTAMRAGFPAERIIFHGNGKSDAELGYAMDQGIFCFVADGPQELERLNAAAAERGERIRIMCRLTPGIDPHTFGAVNTGSFDCQFGVPLTGGRAEEFVRKALGLEHLELIGYHCHLGSQIFGAEPYLAAAERMLSFAARIRELTGYVPEYLDLGGGFGVPYTKEDPVPDLPLLLDRIGTVLRDECGRRDLPFPRVMTEPGRSIVADAGITLYRVAAVKETGAGDDYLVLDGGMTDDPRYALYGSRYTVLNADRMTEPAMRRYTVAGRCCESGALIARNVLLPETYAGDLVAVCVTGAYNYSMASNYNRLPKLPVVLVREGKARPAVRRQTWADVAREDLGE